MKFTFALMGSGFLALSVAGCDQSVTDGSAADSSSVAATPTQWILTDLPEGAAGVTELKSTAVEGEAVVIRGRIGGSKAPLSAGSPVFTLVDLSLPSCAENPEDRCRTPWDYCCEPRDVLAANMATIQMVDSDGNPLTTDLSQILSPLDEVVVVGTVGARPTAGVLTVRASGIYVNDG